MQNRWLGLGGWLVVSLIVGGLGAMASVDAAAYYATLTQPSWAPPAWVFGPVWTALYLMMAVAAWRVWSKGGFAQQKTALTFYLVQLLANGLWSWLFFAWKQGAWSFVDINLLWLLIAGTVFQFLRADRIAGWLLLPYWAWVSFAAFLNFSVWQLNPGML